MDCATSAFRRISCSGEGTQSQFQTKSTLKPAQGISKLFLCLDGRTSVSASFRRCFADNWPQGHIAMRDIISFDYFATGVLL